MEPFFIRQTFSEPLRERLLADIDWFQRKGDVKPDDGRSRIISNNERLCFYAEHLLPVAREIFQDDSILPSYNCWARYTGPGANLERHKDKNACTFTIDYCVQSHEPWGLFVEGREYLLEDNQSLAFMGEDQEHWRGPFASGNMVEMIFFHFVRPDHWYFTDYR